MNAKPKTEIFFGMDELCVSLDGLCIMVRSLGLVDSWIDFCSSSSSVQFEHHKGPNLAPECSDIYRLEIGLGMPSVTLCVFPFRMRVFLSGSGQQRFGFAMTTDGSGANLAGACYIFYWKRGEVALLVPEGSHARSASVY